MFLSIPNIFFTTFHSVTLEFAYQPTHFGNRIFVFGSHQEVLNGFCSNENTCIPYFPHIFLNSHSGLWCMVLLCRSSFCWRYLLCCCAGKYHYCCFQDLAEHCSLSCSRSTKDLHLSKNLCRCSSSCCKTCGLEHTGMTL